MAITQIAKIKLIASIDKQDEVLEAVQNTALVQIIEQEGKSHIDQSVHEKLASIDYKIAGAKFCLSFLSDYANNRSLINKLNLKIELKNNEAERVAANFRFKIFKEVQEIQKNIIESQNIISKNKAEIESVAPWVNLPFVASLKLFPPYLKFKLARISPSKLSIFKDALSAKSNLWDIGVVNSNRSELLFYIIYHANISGDLELTLNDLMVKCEDLPQIEIQYSEYINLLNKEINDNLRKISDEEAKAVNYASGIRDMKILHDYLIWQKDRLLVKQKNLLTNKTFAISGWIERSKMRRFEQQVGLVTKNYFIEEIQPEVDEQIPVAYNNSWLARPFEFVTSIYGVPKNGSPDPTPFLAPFFVVFFGLCLTDAGYGIIISIIALLALKIAKPSGSEKNFYYVLFYGGLITFFAGAFVGGWFGIIIDDLQPGIFKSILLNLRLIDPVKDPITMLIFSLALGIVHILAGIAVNIWWKFKNGNIKSALLDDCAWLYLLISILFWGMHKTGVLSFSASKYFAILGLAVIILTQGRKAKNPVLKLANGVISLYGLVGYLSDVLSYSRLLALGLATGIIAMVVNLIASLTVNMVPYLGYAIALVVLVGGHIFNLAINALGSFIHSSRLQFVEFFPKFMEGGGVPFEPLRKDCKYTKINNI